MSLIPLVDVVLRASPAPQRDFAALPEDRRNFSGHRQDARRDPNGGGVAGGPEAEPHPAVSGTARRHIVDVFAR